MTQFRISNGEWRIGSTGIFLLALTLGLLASPLALHAQEQQARKPYRIALLPDFPPAWESLLKVFTETLRESGRIEGRDYVLYRSGILYGQDIERAVRRAVDEKPDLIFTSALNYAIAAHQLTKTIPIVMRTSGFPVEGGVAMSLARPGKNVTGLTIYAGTEVFGKLLQLLLEAKPGIKRVGVLWGYVPPAHPREEVEPMIREVRDAARLFGIDIRLLEIAKPEQTGDALATLVAERVEALLLTSGAPIRRQEIMQFAVEKRLPTIPDFSWVGVEPQPLLTYSPPAAALMRQATAYVERILWGGAKPGDLPIQLPAKFELVVNLKTAKAIGLTIPQSLLIRADQVIQ